MPLPPSKPPVLSSAQGASAPEWPWHVHRDGELPEAREDWIFVFGSNLAGRHTVGSARIARERFGALPGVGMGPTGRAVAIPTKGHQLEVLDVQQIGQHVALFLQYASDRPQERFWITRVGCGPAGHSNAAMAHLFAAAGANCSMPLEWAVLLRPQTPARRRV